MFLKIIANDDSVKDYFSLSGWNETVLTANDQVTLNLTGSTADEAKVIMVTPAEFAQQMELWLQAKANYQELSDDIVHPENKKHNTGQQLLWVIKETS